MVWDFVCWFSGFWNAQVWVSIPASRFQVSLITPQWSFTMLYSHFWITMEQRFCTQHGNLWVWFCEEFSFCLEGMLRFEDTSRRLYFGKRYPHRSDAMDCVLHVWIIVGHRFSGNSVIHGLGFGDDFRIFGNPWFHIDSGLRIDGASPNLLFTSHVNTAGPVARFKLAIPKTKSRKSQKCTKI